MSISDVTHLGCLKTVLLSYLKITCSVKLFLLKLFSHKQLSSLKIQQHRLTVILGVSAIRDKYKHLPFTMDGEQNVGGTHTSHIRSNSLDGMHQSHQEITV